MKNENTKKREKTKKEKTKNKNKKQKTKNKKQKTKIEKWKIQNICSGFSDASIFSNLTKNINYTKKINFGGGEEDKYTGPSCPAYISSAPSDTIGEMAASRAGYSCFTSTHDSIGGKTRGISLLPRMVPILEQSYMATAPTHHSEEFL
jgi:hypothetical protein